MIKFLNNETVAGHRYGKGTIAQLDVATEAILIGLGDAVVHPMPILIGQSYAPVTRSSANTAADASYETLGSVTVAGGLMGANGVLRITVDWSYNNSASSKILTINWGGSQISFSTVTTTSGAKYLVEVANANSSGTQAIQSHTTYGAATRLTDTTEDTTQDVVIDFPARWGAAVLSESITLIGYSIWLYPGND